MKYARLANGTVLIGAVPKRLILTLATISISVFLLFLFYLRSDSLNEGTIVACLFGFAGPLLTALMFISQPSFVFDKEKEQLVWKRCPFLEERSGEISFSDVRDVVVDAIFSPRGSARHIASYRVVLVTNRGEMPLERYYGAFLKPRLEVARALLTVLNLNQDAVIERSLKRLLAKNSDAEARSFVFDHFGWRGDEAKNYLEGLKTKEAQTGPMPNVPEFIARGDDVCRRHPEAKSAMEKLILPISAMKDRLRFWIALAVLTLGGLATLFLARKKMPVGLRAIIIIGIIFIVIDGFIKRKDSS